MSIKYKVVGRKINIAPKKGQVLYGAQPVYLDDISFKRLCSRIAEYSSVTSADVKAVIDRMLYVMNEELLNGRIVRLGELGSFRLSFGSASVEDEKEFKSSLIRTPKILFTPAKEVRMGLATRGEGGLIFERVTSETGRNKKKTPPKGKEEKPGEGQPAHPFV